MGSVDQSLLWQDSERQMIERLSAATAIYEVDGEVITALCRNQAYYQMIGARPQEREQFDGPMAMEAVWPDDRMRVMRVLRDAMPEYRPQSGSHRADAAAGNDVNNTGAAAGEDMDRTSAGSSVNDQQEPAAGAHPTYLRYRLLDGNGRYVWVEAAVTFQPIREGAARVYACFRDIDELVRIRQGQQEDDQLMREVISQSEMLYFVYHIQERRAEIIVVPEKLPELPSEMVPFAQSMIGRFDLSEDAAEQMREMVARIERGADSAECSVQLMLGDVRRWYRFRMISIREPDGSCRRAIGFASDIDEFQTAQIRLSNEQLALESVRDQILNVMCFDVTQDTTVYASQMLSGREEPSGYGSSMEMPGSAGADRGSGTGARAEVPQPRVYTEADRIYREALMIDPRLANQKAETLSVLLSSAEKIPDPAQRRTFILNSSHYGMIDLYHNGQTETQFETCRITDRGLRWLSTQIRLLNDPVSGHLMAFFYVRDITDQKEKDQLINLLIESGCDYVVLLDPTRRTARFRYMSEEVRRVAPVWHPDEETDYVSAMRQTVMKLIPEDEQAYMAKASSLKWIFETLRADPAYVFVYNMKLPDGTMARKQVKFCWLDETCTLILGIQTDITAAYRKEQQDIRGLEEAARQAQEANRAKTEFLSRISHDIRTPIGAVKNLLGFAREDMHDPERLTEDLDRIESSNRYLLSLINDVLDMSKVDSGKMQLHPEPISCREFVEDIRSILEPMCADQKLTCIVEDGVQSADFQVMADRIRLNQITLNILSNAVKYTPAGGSVTFVPEISRRSDGIILFGYVVRDTGIGMSKTFQQHMFEEFSQEYDNPLRNRMTVGTGLGLPIVKKMLDLMGGTIEVDSEVGRGTAIRIRIPLRDAANESGVQTDGGSDAPEAEAALSGRVLLVEDNEINVLIADRILQTFGLTVDHAADGREGVQAFTDAAPGTYAAILMDVQMPVMDGYEATRTIRQMAREDAGRIPIIAMSADAFGEAVQKGYAAGMNEYVTKPLDVKLLRRVLARYCGR